jgi:hypothetical protein
MSNFSIGSSRTGAKESKKTVKALTLVPPYRILLYSFGHSGVWSGTRRNLDTVDIFHHFLYVTLLLSMDNGKNKEDSYSEAKSQHTSLDRRLQMLLKKPFLTESEEIEVRELKKRKLYYKDLMERLKKGQPEE